MEAAIRQAGRDARVAPVTGWELDEEQRQAARVQAVFRKPMDLTQLLSFIGAEEPQPTAPSPSP